MSKKQEFEVKKSSMKEIKLTLQQTVCLSIDNNWTMNDIKQAAKREFGHIADLFTIFIKDYEVTNLENVNLQRTLDYYKSNTIYIVPRVNKILNERILNEDENINILSLNNSHSLIQTGDILNSSGIQNKSRNENLYCSNENKYHRTLDIIKNPENQVIRNKIDDAYSNLDKLKKTIADFNIRSDIGLNKSHCYNTNDRYNGNILDHKNTSINHINHNISGDNMNIISNPLSSSMFLSKNQNINIINDGNTNTNKDFLVSPIRNENLGHSPLLGNTNSNFNQQPYSKVDEILTNIKNKLNMSKGDNFSPYLRQMDAIQNKNESFFSMNSPKSGYLSLEGQSKQKHVQFAQPITNNISYPNIITNPSQSNKFPQSEEDFRHLLEDNRNIHLTNQILNKSNIELKNQLKRLEEDLESNSELKAKLANQNQFIENLKIEMSNLIKSNEEVVKIYEMLKVDYVDLDKENEVLKQKLQNISENFFVTEKTNQNLKSGIEKFEDALKNYDNEKSIINIHLIEKEKQIFELSEKDKNNRELNQSLKKSLNDYEEMLANMNKTMEILKKSTDDCEREIFKLKCVIDEKNSLIESKSKEVTEKTNENSNLNDELNLIRNELKYFNDEVQTKLKVLDELQGKNGDLSAECDKYKMKIQNLMTIIEEKDNTVENMKISYNALNKTLEEIKNEYDEIKRKHGDDLIEKNRLLKEKKSGGEFNSKIEKKLEELLIIKNEHENELKMNKNVMAILEEENSKLKFNNENLFIEISGIKNFLSDKDKLIQSLEIKLKEYDDKIHKLIAELEEVEKHKYEIYSDKNVYESKFNEVNSKYENLLQKFNQNLSFTDEMNKKYESLLQQNYKFNTEKKFINDTYGKLEKDFRDLIKQANTNNPKLEGKEKLYTSINLNLKTQKDFVLNNSFNFGGNATIEETSEKNSKIQIIEGSKFIFTIYDNRSILSFDLESRKFKVSEFADYGEFEENYKSEGSITLNVKGGMFIVTGDNHDILYYFSHSKNTMNKLTKLKDNHAHGGLIIDNRQNVRNSIICLSGWHNRKIERYFNDEIIANNISTNNSLEINTGFSNKRYLRNNYELNYLPEMTVERSESSYIIIDDKYLYAFFGYCCPKAKYLDSIEYLDLNSNDKWELLKYSNDQHISTFIKSHSLIKISNRDILIIGGYDGKNEVPIETFLKFDNMLGCITPVDRKLPDIMVKHFYNFQKDSSFVPFVDVNDRLHFASIDDMDNVHVVEVKTLQYDVFKFD